MALTKSLIADSVFGNHRVQCWDVTPDAAATAFVTGMNNIEFMTVTAKSALTDATFGVFTENTDVSGTSVAGTIAMTSVVTSGEIKYRFVVYGSA